MKSKVIGFTLIELMIVIAIVAILVALALPAYLEYSIRSKNGECLSVASGAKLAVAENFQSNGTLPANNTAAGFEFNGSKYCSSIAITDGEITATTNTGSGVVFTLTPNTSNGRIDWDCATNTGIRLAHVPASCRTP